LKDNLQISPKYQHTADISQRIVNILNTFEGNNLLVLDDADDEFNQIRRILPLNANWKIIATSRFEFDSFPSLTIGSLTKNATIELFYKHYYLHQNDEIIIELFEPLDYHALSVELFAKTAQFHKLPLTDLKKRVLSLSFDFGKKTNINSDHSTVLIDNLGRYYEKIFPIDSNPKDEIEILRKFALLPSVFVEINDLFKLFTITPKQEEQFSYNLNRLVQKGWLSNLYTAYKLNPIIRKFIEYKFTFDFGFYEKQVTKVRHLLSVDTVKDSPVSTFKWLPFGQQIIDTFEFIDIEIVTLANNLALRYRDNGNFAAARNILEQVLKYDTKIYGDDSSMVMLSLANLGNVLSDLGEYNLAAEYLERSLNAATKNYPAGHPKIAVRQSNLGIIYRDLGRVDEAIELLEASLASDLITYAKDDPTVAVRQSNLALAYKDFGEYTKARDLLEESIATTIKHYGKMHPRVALRQSNLALVYKAMGEYRKAVDLLETALKADKENFGEVHPKIAVRLMNLAIIYLEISELSRAKERITTSLSVALVTLGEHHPDTEAIKKMYDKIYRVA
ncbi:MAG: tetratricopeptide repeat protein, partial [Chloroflexia bacterium]|nr:tetratricopeptide repeat protein [Chloroflexia bacterium]